MSITRVSPAQRKNILGSFLCALNQSGFFRKTELIGDLIFMYICTHVCIYKMCACIYFIHTYKKCMYIHLYSVGLLSWRTQTPLVRNDLELKSMAQGEREIYFKEFAHVIVGTDKFKSCRTGQQTGN